MVYQAGYAISDIASLKALTTADLVDGYARWVISKNTWYGWNSVSNALPNDDTVVAIASDPIVGRFIKSWGARELLTSDRTYFVRIDGSDANTGLTDTDAFLTIQKAIDSIRKIDLNSHNIKIKVDDGNYFDPLILKTLTGEGEVTIEGNVLTPGNVIIAASSLTNSSIIDDSAINSRYFLKGFRLQSIDYKIDAIAVSNLGNILSYENLEFGTNLSNNFFVSQGTLICTGSYKILAQCDAHWYIEGGRLAAQTNPTIVELGVDIDFALAFLVMLSQSSAYVEAYGTVSFAGSATGKKFILRGLSYFEGSDGDINFLPGTIDGTIEGNSVYE